MTVHDGQQFLDITEIIGLHFGEGHKGQLARILLSHAGRCT